MYRLANFMSSSFNDFQLWKLPCYKHPPSPWKQDLSGFRSPSWTESIFSFTCEYFMSSGVSGFLWVFCKGPSAYKIYIYMLIYLTYEIKDALEGKKFPFLKGIYHKCGQWYASASQSKRCYFLMGQEDVSPRTTQRKQSRPKQLFWLNPVCENLLFHKL